MWRVIAGREIRGHLLNGRFAAVLVLSGGLFLALGVLGARNYNHQRDDYEARVSGHREQLTTYKTLYYVDANGLFVDRPPAPLSSMIRGAEGSVGNILRILRLTYPQYTGGASDSPLVTAFEPVDFLFVIKLVLSLCALLLTFDAISGERENGTLALALSAPVSRLHLLAGKLAGAFVSLVVPASIAFAAGVAAVVLLLEHPLPPVAWPRIAAVWGVAIVYMTIFLCVGLLASSLARRSIVSLQVALLAWLLLVIMAPRVLVAAAGRVSPAPDMTQVEAEVETVRQVARRNALRKLHYIVESTRQQLSVPTVFLTNRAEANAGVARVHGLREAYERQRRRHDRVGRTLMMLAPAGALASASMTLAGTDLSNYDRYIDDFRPYRQRVLDYYGQFTNRGMRFDAASVEPFHPTQPSFAETVAAVGPQLGALATWLVLALGGAAIGLYRYDPR